MASAELLQAVQAEAARRLLDARLTKEIALPTPAAGAEFVATVPAGSFWHIHSLSVEFITGVAVANRLPLLVIQDPVRAVLVLPPTGTQPASTDITYAWVNGAGYSALVGTAEVIQLPPYPYWLPAGWQVKSLTPAIQAADTYLTPTLLVQEISALQIRQQMAEIATLLDATNRPSDFG